ncbi:MAG: oxygen-independent coproporphyrinogen III oxidase [Gemmatimonadaceae bacterium]|nr:oxygen-independent coproporphyrinogen III oxidase [Gemmatimonadaceae bacterium]
MSIPRRALDTGEDVRPVGREVTAELLARHDRPGPRYTSYPTAVEFHEGVGTGDYIERLAAADRLGDAPLSLYMHLPFCEQRCLFCGCHVIITRHRDVAEPYLELVKREVELLAERLPNRRRFAQLHLGGGTPTYFSPAQLTDLLGHTLQHFPPAPGAELALEADPRVTTTGHIDALAELGFNRISFGVQDFTPEVQESINRVQSLEQTAALVEHARRRGFRGINVDLIYGLPLQTPESFERTINSVIELGVDRAAVYSFAFVPWVRGHQKKIEEDQLPDARTKVALFAIARERFLRAGYEPIGMDHFARPDDELALAKHDGRLRRNFQGYAVIPGDDVLGIGISAIGDVRGAYVQNEKKLSTYEERIRAGELPVMRGVARSADDEVRRAVIHELMCNFRVDTADISRRFGVDFASYFAHDLALLAGHEREGLVKLGHGRIEATPVGELFVRNLAMCFDRYQREKHDAESRPVFSRTV